MQLDPSLAMRYFVSVSQLEARSHKGFYSETTAVDYQKRRKGRLFRRPSSREKRRPVSARAPARATPSALHPSNPKTNRSGSLHPSETPTTHDSAEDRRDITGTTGFCLFVGSCVGAQFSVSYDTAVFRSSSGRPVSLHCIAPQRAEARRVPLPVVCFLLPSLL